MPTNEPNRRVPAVLHRQQPLHTVALAPPFHQLRGDIPAYAASVPSMMSESEKRFVYGLTKEYWSNRGLIVDAGLMCGASTVLFGEAIRAAGSSKGRRIVSIERAIAGEGEARFIRKTCRGSEVPVGGDFRSIIETHVAPVRELVDLRFGDIADVGAVDDAVEILYLDVLKTRATAAFAFKAFFPRLLADAFILQQDYFTDFMPWIKEMQEYICQHARHVAYLGEIGPMAIFRCEGGIGERICRDATAETPYEMATRLLAAAEQRSIDPHRRLLCALSRVWRAAEMRGPDLAATTLSGIEQTYAAQIDECKFKRVSRAVGAARHLCNREWSVETADTARLIATGNTPEAGDPIGAPS